MDLTELERKLAIVHAEILDNLETIRMNVEDTDIDNADWGNLAELNYANDNLLHLISFLGIANEAR